MPDDYSDLSPEDREDLIAALDWINQVIDPLHVSRSDLWEPNPLLRAAAAIGNVLDRSA